MRRLEEIADAAGGAPSIRQLRIEALRAIRALRNFEPRVRREDLVSVGPVSSFRLAIRGDMDRLAVRRAIAALVPEGNAHEFGVDDKIEPIHLGHGIRLEITEDDPSAADDLLDEREVMKLVLEDVPATDLEGELHGIDQRPDRFAVYRLLLSELENVEQDPAIHPEGDALFHSLQAFDLALADSPYDEEFLTAALLHDVGKIVDARDHQSATLELLDGLVTRRTRWLIEQFPAVRPERWSRLSPDERRALAQSSEIDTLRALAEMDQQARRPGVPTTSLDEALVYLESLDRETAWDP